MSEGELLAAYVREVDGLQRGAFRFRYELDARGAVMLIGLLQLALRLPGNRGPTAEFGRSLVAELTKQIPRECTAIHEVIKLGWSETP
jgi:hypothetical protein